MDSKKLFDAARAGDLEVLVTFLEENPSILVDLRLISPLESLLHVATKAGQLNFVHEVLKLDPEVAGELNKDGFRPLDIAVIMGDLSIVKELLRADGELCQLKGKYQRTALHYAAMKGRVDIIEELLSTCPESIQDVMDRGETSLHLCVKNYQFEAFSVLIKWLESKERLSMQPVVNLADCDGNTVMHIAVLTKQYATIDLLLNKSSIRETIKVNATNDKGLTALDILDIVIEDSDDARIREILQAAGAVKGQDVFTIITEESPKTKSIRNQMDPPSEHSKSWLKYFKFQIKRDSPSDTRNALLVVAALIAAVSFQAGVSPPAGILDKNSPRNPTGGGGLTPEFGPVEESGLAAAAAIFGSHATAFMFLFTNSLGLTASLCIIIYLTGGFPFQRELHISLYSMMFTYGFAISSTLEGTKGKNKIIAYLLLTLAFALPFAQRWLPWWGKKAWKNWRRQRVIKS